MTSLPTAAAKAIDANLAASAQLDPPRGYRPLAWLGLVLNALAIPAAVLAILWSPTWRTTNIAVIAAAVLPTAVLAIVACIALLRWRPWGQVLAIVALSLSLAVTLPYAIVRLILVQQDRLALALAAPLLWGAIAASLVYWCRPAIRQYLR